MHSTDEIRQWLTAVANARLAVAQILSQNAAANIGDKWELDQAAEYLTNAYLAGFDAYRKAAVREYLAAEKADAVA